MTDEGNADRYLSVEDGPETETRIQGSRFVGHAFRAESAADADARLTRIRRRLHDASHHCWAWRLGPPEAYDERSDDDGEPSGTAGAPMLAVLRGAELHDVLVVVTRWFGGTKLGKGGLIRAYSGAARDALDAAPERVIWRESTLTVGCEYEDVGAVEAVLARSAADVRACVRDFSDRPTFRITVLRSRLPGLVHALREATAGRAALDA